MNGKAETIEGAILHYLGNKTLQITKLCAFGSDRCCCRLQGHSPKLCTV